MAKNESCFYRPKILHVIDHTEEGGAQVVIRQLIEKLGKEFAISVAVLGRRGRFSESYRRLGVPVLELGDRRGRWNPFPVFSLVRAIRHGSYDLVHTHLMKSSILGTIAAACMRRKIILHDHTSINRFFLEFYFRRLPMRCIYSLLFKLVLGICHRIIVLTPAARIHCHETFAVKLQKIHVIPNGVDSRRIFNCDASNRSIRNELGLNSETRLVLMVGRLEPEKDWMTFLRVAQSVPKLTQINVAFLVIGTGTEEQDLRDYAAKNNLSKVYFLGYRNDVRRLMSDADVFLLTSKFEPFGIVVLEAMLVGCPIVATRSEGPESILTHEVTGLLGAVGDVEGLAREVVRVMHDDVLRRSLVRNAQERATRSYSIESSTSVIAQLYRTLLPDTRNITHSRNVSL